MIYSTVECVIAALLIIALILIPCLSKDEPVENTITEVNTETIELTTTEPTTEITTIEGTTILTTVEDITVVFIESTTEVITEEVTTETIELTTIEPTTESTTVFKEEVSTEPTTKEDRKYHFPFW